MADALLYSFPDHSCFLYYLLLFSFFSVDFGTQEDDFSHCVSVVAKHIPNTPFILFFVLLPEVGGYARAAAGLRNSMHTIVGQ